MSERVFPPGHFITGKALGVEDEFSTFGLIAAELELTLPIVEEARPDAKFGPRELRVYHALQYGGALPEIDIAIGVLESGDFPGWFKPDEVMEKSDELLARIDRLTGGEGLSEPVPLGRIAVGYDAEVCDELRSLTISRNSGSNLNGRRWDRFLYPRGDVSLGYGGKHEPSEELAEFLKGQKKVDPLSHGLELDDIVAERDNGETQGFVAVSHSQGLRAIHARTK
ncbi:MAG TPA: hypothetical protein VFW77_04395 [Candidatus Saccharimonadales bacterium]|nr:hypothetical protein [Candidatus Saccharimonadales bacterium]